MRKRSVNNAYNGYKYARNQACFRIGSQIRKGQTEKEKTQ